MAEHRETLLSKINELHEQYSAQQTIMERLVRIVDTWATESNERIKRVEVNFDFEIHI